MGRVALPLAERLRNYRVDARTGCWVWRGNLNEDGYGRLWQRVDGKRKLRYAHIVSYEFHVGPVPEGLELDHTCRNHACINPAHLEPVTHAENIRRGTSPAAVARGAEHCPQGHPYDAANTYERPDGTGRGCRACNGRTGRPNGWQQKAKTHCPSQHPYDEANTRVKRNGHRSCKTCEREKRRQRRVAI